jgi:hypothetical protein
MLHPSRRMLESESPDVASEAGCCCVIRVRVAGCCIRVTVTGHCIRVDRRAADRGPPAPRRATHWQPATLAMKGGAHLERPSRALSPPPPGHAPAHPVSRPSASPAPPPSLLPLSLRPSRALSLGWAAVARGLPRSEHSSSESAWTRTASGPACLARGMAARAGAGAASSFSPAPPASLPAVPSTAIRVPSAPVTAAARPACSESCAGGQPPGPIRSAGYARPVAATAARPGRPPSPRARTANLNTPPGRAMSTSRSASESTPVIPFQTDRNTGVEPGRRRAARRARVPGRPARARGSGPSPSSGRDSDGPTRPAPGPARPVLPAETRSGDSDAAASSCTPPSESAAEFRPARPPAGSPRGPPPTRFRPGRARRPARSAARPRPAEPTPACSVRRRAALAPSSSWLS